MLSDIWRRCGAAANLGPLRVRAWRIVEAQHVVATQKLADTAADQLLLEELLDEHAKPPRPTGPVFDRLHYLLHTPFRYPPLRRGSRFGRRHERGIWYGAERIDTALAETAYYRWVFLAGSEADLTPLTSHHTAFRAGIATGTGVDLHERLFEQHRGAISSPTDYAATQVLGAAMRADGVTAFRYRSARDPAGGVNVGVFTPAAFDRKKPLDEQTWYCHATDGRVIFNRTTAARPTEFLREDFLVEGRLPSPAL